MINWYKKFPKAVIGFDPVQPYGRALDICWLDRKNLKLLHTLISPIPEAQNIRKLIEYNLNNYRFDSNKIIEAKEELIAFDRIRNQDYSQVLHKNIVQLLQKY